jgi:tRNA-specific 2-thiouridylase
MKRVVVGMSGGIDSSVTAYLLKEEGYEVVGATMRHLKEEYTCGNSSFEQDIIDAQNVCKMLGIEHYIIDMREEFDREVVDYFLLEYGSGRTPSPCVVCDEKIKMKSLIKLADSMGIEYIATGHYSKVVYSDEFLGEILEKAKDERKDQTYMLYRLDRSVIKRMLTPLSKYKKEEIRNIAEKIGFKIHSKKDSQGLCFAPEGYIDFIIKKLGDKVREGNFVDREGKILGKHKGYQLYTVGQRRGLDLKLPRAYFVTNISPEKNEVVLGDFDELKRKKIMLEDCKFIVSLDKLVNLNLVARARFSSSGLGGRVLLEGNNISFLYDEANCQCAPGQHLVIYYGNKVVGGGIIV